MNIKYNLDGHFKFKGKIPGIGKFDLDVKHLYAEGDMPDELVKELFDKAYEVGLQLDKEVELGE